MTRATGDDALAANACGQHKDLITPAAGGDDDRRHRQRRRDDGAKAILYEVTNSRGDVVKSLNSSVAHRATSSQNAQIIQQMLISTGRAGHGLGRPDRRVYRRQDRHRTQPGGDQGEPRLVRSLCAGRRPPPLAVAVVVENGGTGGKVAGPVAAQVLKAALGEDN